MKVTIELEVTAIMALPLISIVIPAFEADVELRRCVDSVRVACADRARCELLVVMPAGRVAEGQQWLRDERVIAERYPSIYGAMNDGAAASRGRYLYFLGKDDIVLPPFGEMLDILDSSRPSAMFFNVYWGVKGVYLGRPSRWKVLTRNLCHQGIVYSRETYDRHGPYLRRMTVQADHLLNIRLLWDRTTFDRVEYLPLPLAWYSGTGFSVKRAADPVFWRLYPTILRKHIGPWARVVLLTWRALRGRCQS